jgi:hypothetical protein
MKREESAESWWLKAEGWFYARNHYVTMRRLQEPQLHDDEEQEKAAGPAGAEEILLHLPAPHGP